MLLYSITNEADLHTGKEWTWNPQLTVDATGSSLALNASSLGKLFELYSTPDSPR